MKKIS
ncbi:modulating protein ymoA, partial [Yersinia pestis PY-66]|jgi:predicted acylesterase/phospholipase RssA